LTNFLLLLPPKIVYYTIYATTQSHAAYASFTHGFISRWLYVSCAVPDISSFFQPFEKALLTKSSALTGLGSSGALHRSLFVLPTRFGGLIVTPDSLSPQY